MARRQASLDPQTLAIELSVALASGVLWALVLAMTATIGDLGYVLPPVAAVLAAATVAAVAAIDGRPHAVAAMLAFSILVPNLSFRDRPLGETGLDLQNGTKFAAWALMLAMALRHWRLIAHYLRDPGLRLAALFAGFALASAAWSPVPAYTAGCAIGNFAWLGLAILAVSKLSDAVIRRVLLWSLFAEVAIGLVGGIAVPDLTWMAPSDMETDYRLRGVSGHPNLLAQHAALLVLALLSARDAKLVGPRASLVVFLAAGLALVLSGSRVTVIATAVAWLVPSLRDRGMLRQTVMALVGLVILGLGLKTLGTMPDLGDLLGGLSRSGSASEITTLTGRTDLWAIAWEHFLEHPLLGWGFNGTERLMADSVGRTFEGNAVNAHNVVLQSLMTLGLCGSLLVAGLFAVLIMRSVSRPDATRDRFVIYLLILGTGEAEPLSVPMTMSFLLFWCLARDASMRAEPGPRPSKVRASDGQTSRIKPRVARV